MSRADAVRLARVIDDLEAIGLLSPEATFEDFEAAVDAGADELAVADEHVRSAETL